jgi:hypothetical protein
MTRTISKSVPVLVRTRAHTRQGAGDSTSVRTGWSTNTRRYLPFLRKDSQILRFRSVAFLHVSYTNRRRDILQVGVQIIACTLSLSIFFNDET